jgi:hypothetical protein
MPPIDEIPRGPRQPFPPPAGVADAAPDSDGWVWINPAKFREGFRRDLSADEALVMVVTQKAPVGSTFRSIQGQRCRARPATNQIRLNRNLPSHPGISIELRLPEKQRR